MVNDTQVNSAANISFDITCCQVPLHVRTWFHDLAGDIDFQQMFLSQSESTLHESIILMYI